MAARLRAPGWYRAVAFIVIGFAFCFALSVGIRKAYGYTPTVDWDAILQISMIGVPLFFLVGLGAFDYWFYWAAGRPTRPEDHSTHGATKWQDYFRVNTDHKVIGIQYIVTSFFFMFLGGLMAMLMRAELAAPGRQFVDSNTFNGLFSVHASLMIFLFIIPIFAGIANYVIPLMIGAPDMAFPRLNALSFWMLPVAGVMMMTSFLAPGGSFASGWTAYAPLSVDAPIGQAFFTIGVQFAGASSIATALNFLALFWLPLGEVAAITFKLNTDGAEIVHIETGRSYQQPLLDPVFVDPGKSSFRIRRDQQHCSGATSGPERPIEKRKDHKERERDDYCQACERALLILELTAPDQELTLWRLHLTPYDGHCLLDDRAHVSSFDIELESEHAAVGLAVDVGATHGGFDSSDLAEGHPVGAHRWYQDCANPPLILSFRNGEQDPYRDRPLLLPELRGDAAGKGGLDDILGDRDADASTSQRGPVENNLELWNARVSVKTQIYDAWNLLQRSDALLQRGPHENKVCAESLEDDLSAHATHRLLHVVLDGL